MEKGQDFWVGEDTYHVLSMHTFTDVPVFEFH